MELRADRPGIRSAFQVRVSPGGEALSPRCAHPAAACSQRIFRRCLDCRNGQVTGLSELTPPSFTAYAWLRLVRPGSAWASQRFATRLNNGRGG